MLTHRKEREAVWRRRRAAIVAEVGEVTPYAVAVGGKPVDVAPKEKRRREPKRVTAPDDPNRQVSQQEFDEMVRDLHVDEPRRATAVEERDEPRRAPKRAAKRPPQAQRAPEPPAAPPAQPDSEPDGRPAEPEPVDDAADARPEDVVMPTSDKQRRDRQRRSRNRRHGRPR